MTGRRSIRPRVVFAIAIVVLAVAAVGLALNRSTSSFTGRVMDMDGRPVRGATVTIGQASTRSADDGTFRIDDGPRVGWVRAEAAGYLPRIRPARRAHEVVVRLTPDDGRTISLVFGGDVMAGRRFFDVNEDGNRSDKMLEIGADGSAHARLLEGVRPALESADLAIVNLETPLISDPWFDPRAPRPARFHPTKEFVFASSPGLAAGLQLAGVDITGVANNHVRDALDPGVDETLRTLDAAGFAEGVGRYGAGRTAPEAWIPAVREVKGRRIAFMGCTTVTGEEHKLLYVATATTAGAAACDQVAIREHVTAAVKRGEVVVFSIHGGFEYEREPSDRITLLSRAAREAGAALVVNHHPHVVGGIAADTGGLVAWTIGNLLFDQTVWPTFPGYLLTVYLRDGLPVRAVADPILIDDFVPVGLVGETADRVARLAAARSTGDVVVDDGALEWGVGVQVEEAVASAAARGSIERIGPGWQPAPGGAAEAGRDLLWYGSFEDDDIDAERLEGDLWLRPDRDRSYGPRGAAMGAGGVQLTRDAANDADVVLAPAHRVPAVEGRAMSFLARVRSRDIASFTVQFSWYNDLRGESQGRSVATLPVVADWTVVRVDLVVPKNALAMLPMVRLSAPRFGKTILDVDDVVLIEWLPGTAASSETTYIRSAGVAVALLARVASGGHKPGPPSLDLLSERPAVVDEPPPLPAGPAGVPVE